MEKLYHRLVYDSAGRLLYEEQPEYYIMTNNTYDAKGRLLRSEGTGGETTFEDSLGYFEGGYDIRSYSSGRGDEIVKRVKTNEKDLPVSASGKVCSIFEDIGCDMLEEKWLYNDRDSLVFFSKKLSRINPENLHYAETYEELHREYDPKCGLMSIEKRYLDKKLARDKKVFFDNECRILRIEDKVYSVINGANTTENTYDNAGLLRKKVIRMVFGADVIHEERIYEYDKEKRILSETTFLYEENKRKEIEKSIYVYAKDGSFEQTAINLNYGTSVKSYFDTKGVLQKSDEINSEGKIERSYFYKYTFF